MPNLCNNNLTITGDPSEISRFVKAVTVNYINEETKAPKTEIRILKSLYPCPAELYEVTADFTEKPEMEAKYGASDWYVWCNRYWGTKWGDYDHRDNHPYTEGESTAVFGFTSAWSPPVQGIAKVSEQFPKLSFILTYEEGGMEFLGAVLIVNGVVVQDIEGTYPDLSNFKSTSDTDEYDYDAHFEAVCDALSECENAVNIALKKLQRA